jgi:hypothetical protein
MSRFSNLSSNDYYRNGRNNNDRNKQNNWSNNMSERRERVPVPSSKNLFERFKKEEVTKAPSMTSTEFPHLGTGTFTKHEDKTSTEFLTKTMTETPILPANKKKAYDENTNFENLPGWIVLKGTGEKDIDNSMYDAYQDETRHHLTFSALKRLCIKNSHNNVRLYSCTLDGMFNYAYVLPDMDNDEYDTYVAPDHEIFNYFPKQKIIEDNQDNDDNEYGNISE